MSEVPLYCGFQVSAECLKIGSGYLDHSFPDNHFGRSRPKCPVKTRIIKFSGYPQNRKMQGVTELIGNTAERRV